MTFANRFYFNVQMREVKGREDMEILTGMIEEEVA